MSDWTLEQIESDFADLHGYVYENEIIEERRTAFQEAMERRDKELVVSFLVGGMGFQALVEMANGDWIITLKDGLVHAVRPYGHRENEDA